jgi:antitoxin HicB
MHPACDALRAIRIRRAVRPLPARTKKRISKKRLAELIHTSRAQVDRILDPDKGNVTIETLQRAAALVGRQLRCELV